MVRELEWDKCWFYHVLKMSPQGWSLFSKVETRSGGGRWAKLGITSPEVFRPSGILQCWFWADERWRETSVDDLCNAGNCLHNHLPTSDLYRTQGRPALWGCRGRAGGKHLRPNCVEELDILASCKAVHPPHHPSEQTRSLVAACILGTTNYFPVFAYFCLPVLFCSLQVQERMQWEFPFQCSIKLGNGPGYKWT